MTMNTGKIARDSLSFRCQNGCDERRTTCVAANVAGPGPYDSTSYDWHRRKAAASIFPSRGRLYAGLHLGRLIGCESRNTTARDALEEERATNDEDSKRGQRHGREAAVFRSKRAGIGERLSLCSLLGCCLFGPKLCHCSCRGRPCRRRILRALFHAWHRRA
jgi:hypothetical protein